MSCFRGFVPCHFLFLVLFERCCLHYSRGFAPGPKKRGSSRPSFQLPAESGLRKANPTAWVPPVQRFAAAPESRERLAMVWLRASSSSPSRFSVIWGGGRWLRVCQFPGRDCYAHVQGSENAPRAPTLRPASGCATGGQGFTPSTQKLAASGAGGIWASQQSSCTSPKPASR